jgi:hypothetical protein
MEDVDHKVSLIPDFISGTMLCLLHGKKVQMTDEAIFFDTSEIIKSNRKACFKSKKPTLQLLLNCTTIN